MIFAKEMSCRISFNLYSVIWKCVHANLMEFVGLYVYIYMYLTQEIIMIVQNVKNKLLLSW